MTAIATITAMPEQKNEMAVVSNGDVNGHKMDEWLLDFTAKLIDEDDALKEKSLRELKEK